MLTKRQKQILDYLKRYIAKKDYSPSLEEIKKHFRLSSKSTVHQHIKTLEEKGYLKRTASHTKSFDINESEWMVQVPLLGTIAAGEPIEAIQDKEVIAIPKSKIPSSSEIYALRVTGNSMIDENINSGDIILVKQQETAENGQKVVALIDNHEVTLKKYYQEKGKILLQPANKSMEPLIFRNGQDISIQGIVLDVIRDIRISTPETILPKTTEQAKKTLPILQQKIF
jgi:repressor LexA